MLELMVIAEMLHIHLDTDWAYEHSYLYDSFAEKIEKAYDSDEITAKQFNELAGIAFYEYLDMKDEDDEE